ncbi:MAG: chemotaxis protein CheW [Granulosicoccus sp.]|nr:chemotaxis protein CheW [Granulosicoccus sp.]
MSQHLLFDAAGIYLAAPAKYIKSLHEGLTVQPVAGTKAWFLGLAVVTGKLLPVTDVGAFYGRRACVGRTLELEPSVGIAALRVDQVFGFTDNEPTEIAAGAQHVAENDENLTLTGQVIVDSQRVFRILDLVELVQSSDFIDIKEAQGA